MIGSRSEQVIEALWNLLGLGVIQQPVHIAFKSRLGMREVTAEELYLRQFL